MPCRSSNSTAGKGCAQPVRHLREEALKLVASCYAGRIDTALASVALDVVRMEARQIMDDNLVLARGGVRPPPPRFPGQPGRPRKVRPAKKYQRRVLHHFDAEGNRIKRAYTFKNWVFWAQRSPRLFGHMIGDEERLLDELKPVNLEETRGQD
jgi:hypothetical protein